MSRYYIELAAPAHDAQLRRVAQTPTPGDIGLSFRHEPSFLEAGCVLGQDRQTIVGIDRATGEVIGVGTRLVHEAYVQGQIMRVGYLSALRMVRHARNMGLLARGYRFLKELHEADPHRPPFYLTTIAESNHTALHILTSGRAGLPHYHYLGTLHSLAIARRQRVGVTSDVRSASAAEMGEILSFLHREGRSRQFFPAYAEHAFGGDEPIFRGLRVEQIQVIRRNGEIAALGGVWDQRSFRQTVVESYSRRLRIVRPLYNRWAKWTSGVVLPAIGETMRQCYAAFPVVRHHDRQTFCELLETLAANCPPDASFLTVGLCDNDPLLPVAQRYQSACYRTRVYAVSWEALPFSPPQLRALPLYLELGCL